MKLIYNTKAEIDYKASAIYMFINQGKYELDISNEEDLNDILIVSNGKVATLIHGGLEIATATLGMIKQTFNNIVENHKLLY